MGVLLVEFHCANVSPSPTRISSPLANSSTSSVNSSKSKLWSSSGGSPSLPLTSSQMSSLRSMMHCRALRINSASRTPSSSQGNWVSHATSRSYVDADAVIYGLCSANEADDSVRVV